MRQQPGSAPQPDTDASPQDHASSASAGPATEGADPTPGLAIVHSKIRPVSLSPSLLTRPRLLGWLDQQRDARVTLVLAEAGYGKSTLLADYSSRRDATCIWYRLETSDKDWITFLSYLVAAVREASPEFGRPTEALLRHVAAMGPSREVVVAQFLADLDAIVDNDLVLVLDDYHLVDGSEDVRMIMTQLFERAPERMRFILALRARPDLPLGRLTAQGRVAELTTADLRFTRPEIGQLFATTFAQPIEEATCDIVAERTQGWAASLQLVSASIAASRPSEVASFIEALSGADGPIYDFLAQEVLVRLPESTQLVLLRASLIDRVVPELVAAGLAADHSALAIDDVTACLREAETLGLLSRRDDGRGDMQIHPLLREFLQHHVRQEATDDQIRAMHLAIARAAETTDWLVSGKHYALAGAPDDAMRILGSAASQALGTGAWGAAAEVIALMPDTVPPPAVEVIRARALTSEGRPEKALELLTAIDRATLGSEERALVGLTVASTLHELGHAALVLEVIQEVSRDGSTPSPLGEVAGAWRLMLAANCGGSIANLVTSLDDLSSNLLQAGLNHFAGVTLHNYANAELARANYSHAVSLAREAIGQFLRADDAGRIVASTQSIAAVALAEMGELAKALVDAERALSEYVATADALAELAYLYAVAGRQDRARLLLARLKRGDAPGSRELAARAQALYAEAALAMSSGDSQCLNSVIHRLRHVAMSDIDASSRLAVLEATVAVMEGHSDANALAAKALSAASDQSAWRWSARGRILEAAARRDGEALALWVQEAAESSALAVLELADVIAGSSQLLTSTPSALEKSIAQHPDRWLPAFERQVRRPESTNASAAADLIARFGTLSQIPVLRDFDRSANGRARRRGFVAKLIRRVSATVRVHDLGPTSYEVGDRRITLADTRRKVAALLLYLVSRPSLAASRDQVMEALWPDQLPKSALNSLHQTLFFLRRDIEPWYEDGATANYVRMESDLVFLDSELFQVDGVAFARQCASILAARSALTNGPAMLRLYRGRFAPEFEYEEWADDWRTQLHGTYLRLAHATGEALMTEGRWSDAVDILTMVTTVDPMAFDLRSMLIASLTAAGATDAARAHYEALAALHLRDLGVAARPFEEVIELARMT